MNRHIQSLLMTAWVLTATCGTPGIFADEQSSQVPGDNLGWSWCQYIEFASVAHCWIGCHCYHCPFNVVGVGGGRQVTEQNVEQFHDWIANSEPLRADLTNTGSVDTEDLLILLNAWGGSGAADITCTGEVGVDDLLILLNNWGATQ